MQQVRTPRVFVLLDPAETYDAALLRGISSFSSSGVRWRIFRTPPFWEKITESSLLRLITASRPDGLIMIERENMEPFCRLGIPMVVSPYIRPRLPGCINIVTDHAAVGRMAARHLLELGFRHFGFCGYEGMFWSRERGEGYQSALRQVGHHVEFFPARRCAKETHAEEEVRLTAWLKSLPGPAGIFTALDMRAWQLAELCADTGLEVPGGIGLVGVNNDELLCGLSPFPLSSVAISAERAGFDAARLLDDRIRSRGSRRSWKVVVHPVHVQPRASTDLLEVGDASLVKALRFIRRQRERPIGVADVATAAGISRRALEKRFHARFRRTVLSEIHRVRAETFATLLRETDLSVAEIAERMGFPGAEHVARFFRKRFGVSPLAYRQSSADPGKFAGFSPHRV
jgi:LacI family transcriptional regulator